MKSIILACLFATAVAPMAQAGGPTVAPSDPVPVVAPAPAAYDWSGPYVGLAYGSGSGSMVYDDGDSRDMTGKLGTVFAGYLVQRGSLVYGGELALSRGNNLAQAGYSDENTKNLLDAKARLGLAADRVLFYGSLGYSSATYDANPTDDDYGISGLSYGLGVDYAVSDRMALGLEYLTRKTDSDLPASGVAGLDLNSLSLRVSFRF